MEPTRIILVRHGHTAENGGRRRVHLSGRTDVALSTRGWQDALRLRRWFASLPECSALYSSPLRRALETARIMGESRGLHPTPMPELQEIDCGAVDGAEVDLVRERHPALWSANMSQDDDDFRWPGGESYRELRARSLAALARLAEGRPGRLVVAVSHAGVISQVVGALSGLRPAKWEPFRPENGSLTELEWHAGTVRLLRFDVREHLGDHEKNASARRSTRAQP